MPAGVTIQVKGKGGAFTTSDLAARELGLRTDAGEEALALENSGATAVLRLHTKRSKTIVVEDPTNSEDISMFFTAQAITITEMRAVLVGSATPSVTWTIRHGTDRNAAGAEVVTGGTVTTSTTTGSDVTAFNDATIVADSFVWLETTAQSGTVDEISITIVYTTDA